MTPQSIPVEIQLQKFLRYKLRPEVTISVNITSRAGKPLRVYDGTGFYHV